jgi:hypothetical protein
MVMAVVSPPGQPKKSHRRAAHKNKILKTKFKLKITV